MKFFELLTVLFITLPGGLLLGQVDLPRQTYTTMRLSGSPPLIDGYVTDSAWLQGVWGSGFVQYEPFENAKPAFETEFKILYDNNNLYIAFKAYDTAPDSIEKRLSRRDDGQGDLLAIQFDSYFDQRTGFTFAVTAAGVQVDYIQLNDGQSQDNTWDPIWVAETSITEFGWAAEIMIPFNQLRFGSQHHHTWGFQAARYIFRKRETSLWQAISRTAGGWTSLIGELHGISGITPRRQLQALPYFVAQYETFEKEPGNPFRTGNLHLINTGLDAKVGITNDLTLDLTVNPDFGQVEADPSVINLTAFETFFEEKRPFFIEGRNIMNYPLQSNGNGNNDNLFYSRRIGRQPQFHPELDDEQHIKQPINTTILSAAKLTGKTRQGLSVGIMQSVTANEFATTYTHGIRNRVHVEPLTNYFAARIGQDFDRGNTTIGGMFTSVNRNLSNPDLKFLHSAAYSGGADFEHNWRNKTYTFRARVVMSHIRGDSLAMIRTQRASARHFQRPDAQHLTLDSTLRHLTGHGGTIEFMRGGNVKFRYGATLNWKSPGLEINDIGFMHNADVIEQTAWIEYEEHEPRGIVYSWEIDVAQSAGFDFSGKLIQKGVDLDWDINFSNNWIFSTGFNLNGNSWSRSALRGGPLFFTPGGLGNWIFLMSDTRRELHFRAGWFAMNHWNDHQRTRSVWGGITYRPTLSLSLSLNPSYRNTRSQLQFVSNIESRFGMRYLNATLNQHTMSLSARASLSITPNFTIQYYGQPFISSGNFKEFKKITNPSASNYNDRFELYDLNQIHYFKEDELYQIDENRDGTFDYSFANPDYKALFFQSNMVLRWEYLPGSTLFLVWSQGRDDFYTDSDFSLLEDTGDLFRVHPHDLFLIKVSYRIGVN